MSTLNHEIWANTTTPIFLQAGASASNSAPLVLNSTPAPATRKTVITSTATNGGIYYSDINATEGQAYGELSFSNAGGWDLKTNGVTQLYGTSNAAFARAPFLVDDPQTSDVLLLTTTSIGRNANDASTIIFTPTSIQFGEDASIEDGVGLSINNIGNTKVTTLNPTQVLFSSISTSPTTSTETFAGATLPPAPNGFTTSSAGYGGFTITSDNPTFNNGGLTLTFPSGSPKGLTVTGAPPASGKGIWSSAGTITTPGQSGIYATYINFPPINAIPGSTVIVSWRQTGVYTDGSLYKNDLVYTSLTPYTNLAPQLGGQYDWVGVSISFTSSGDDRLSIRIGNGVRLYVPTDYNSVYNISDISITQYAISVALDASVSMNGSAIRLSNAVSGTYVEADNSGGGSGGVTLSSEANGATLSVNSNIGLTTSSVGSVITLIAPNINIVGATNMSNNTISNVGGLTMSNSAVFNLNSGSVSNAGNINMGSGNIVMNNNSLTGASNITTANLDAVSGASNLLIGYNSTATFFIKLGLMEGIASGGTITNMKLINNDAACATGIFHYLVSFDGTKAVSAPLPPKQTILGRNNNVFGSNYSGDSFVSSVGFTLPANSVFAYSNLGSGVTYTQSNANNVPTYYADGGPGFSPSSSAQQYSLIPIVV